MPSVRPRQCRAPIHGDRQRCTMAARILAKAAGSTVVEAIKMPWGPMLYGAVNKRDLSTGETGELVRENVGFGLNPGVDLAPPRRLLSNRRDRPARENLRNVADTGYGGGCRCRQDNGRGIWYADSLAPRHGFEPRFTAPKAAVLPLDDRGTETKNCSRPV